MRDDKAVISLISLGCDKNLVDSEEMLGLLNKKGFLLSPDHEEADIVILNTCCFILDAKQESIDTIIELERRKEEGSLKGIIVTGCLAERYTNEILEEFKCVDAVLGINSFDMICDAVESILKKDQSPALYKRDINDRPVFIKERLLSTGGHYAYLKIAEGCNKRCTYCIIPHIRGNYRSIPLEDLLDQAKTLVDGGVKEIILVAQETTLYGIDLYGKKSLPLLIEKLSELEDLKWIRLLYCYPEEIDDELIDMMAENKKVCHYIDMPIQHASDDILKKMGRLTDKASIVSVISSLREKIPDICIRTTLITGFPGESEKDHGVLMDFIKEMRFDRLGAFKFSPEEGTKAFDMKDQIKESVKDERFDQIMLLQQDITLNINKELEGITADVMVEGYIPDDEVYVGRTYRDAPDVDGLIFFKYPGELLSGDFVKVKVTRCLDYDLYGEIINEPSE